jgi:hypothetical protein
MNLITEFARRDRAAITARTKEIYAAGDITWGPARARAEREASAELLARFNRHTTVPGISAIRERAIA